VVIQFTARQGVKVKIAMEIQAESGAGFDDGLQRAVRENCNVLKFKNAEFEAEDSANSLNYNRSLILVKTGC